ILGHLPFLEVVQELGGMVALGLADRFENARLGDAAEVAQSWFTPGPTQSGFYIGIESGTTWFLNNNGYSMNTGWTTGAFVGYEFPWGIRAEFSGTYRANTGTGPGQVPTLVDTTTTTTTPTTTAPATATPQTTVTTTTPPTIIPGPIICLSDPTLPL